MFLKNKIYYSLSDLKTFSTRFFLYLFRVYDINYIIKYVIIDFFFDNLGYYSNCHIILFVFLLPKYCRFGSEACLYEFLNIFLHKHSAF